jgi:opacity protein-like surface antigen
MLVNMLHPLCNCDEEDVLTGGMIMIVRTAVGVLSLALCMGIPLYPNEGSAEWYGDAYAGAVWTANTDLTVTSSLGTTTTYQNLDVQNDWTAGGRGGYWLDKPKMDWLGFGLDVFFFHVKTPPGQQVGVVGTGGATTQFAHWSLPAWGIGFDVLRLRLPLLRDEQFVHGRVQPYLAAGPAIFITYAGQNTFVQPAGQRSTDVSVGAKVDAGVTVMVTKRIGAFAQYRFTHFTTELEYRNTSPAPATETFTTTYDSHHAIAGLSLRF